MASYGDFESQQMIAGADLRELRYHVMRISAADTVALATANASSVAFGILWNDPNTGQRATIAYEGRGKVMAGAAISAGAFFTHTTSGRATTVVSGSMCLGRVLNAAGGDGEIVSCIMFPPFRWSGAA